MRRRTFLLAATLAATTARAQEPLRIEITDGAAEPLTLALPAFADEGGAGDLTGPMRDLVEADLTGAGLFRAIPQAAILAAPPGVDAPVAWADWRVVNAEALLVAGVARAGDRMIVRLRVWDVVAGRAAGEGLRLEAPAADWRRLAHRIADTVLTRLTGEGPQFDSRLAVVAETGTGPDRTTRLALVEPDGGGLVWLTDGTARVLAPRLLPDGRALVHVSLAGGAPHVLRLDVATMRADRLPLPAAAQAFAAVPSPDSRRLAVTVAQGGNTDLWLADMATGAARPLTRGPEIDAAPSFTPDGRTLVFESDRSGTPQVYALVLDGLAVRRLSPEGARHAAPRLSPDGQRIALVQSAPDGTGPSRIAVMRADGTGLRLLTQDSLDAAPAWSPNGRMIVFTRRDRAGAPPRLALVDAFGGGVVRGIEMEVAASDPDWGPVLP